MDRLTRRTDGGKIAYAPCGPGECVDVIDLLHVWGERLAAYEDTGLEPEEIEDLKQMWDMYGGEEGITAMLMTPPNPPLTLEELREMDGEPVFVSFDGLVQRKFWAIVYVDQETGAVWAENKFYTLYSHLYGRKWFAYRRKPEEGMA